MKCVGQNACLALSGGARFPDYFIWLTEECFAAKSLQLTSAAQQPLMGTENEDVDKENLEDLPHKVRVAFFSSEVMGISCLLLHLGNRHRSSEGHNRAGMEMIDFCVGSPFSD